MLCTLLPVLVVFSGSSLLLVDAAVKGTVFLVLAAVAAAMLRRDSAATRHLVWLVAIVAMLVVPVLSAMLPRWPVMPGWLAVLPAPVVVDSTARSLALPVDGDVGLPLGASAMEVERPTAIAPQPVLGRTRLQPALVTPEIVPESAGWSWGTALPLVWAIGFGVLVLRLIAARWMLWDYQRRATEIRVSKGSATDTQELIVTALQAACRRLEMRRPVTLLIHPEETIPLAWGILRYRLLLPRTARQWSGEQLRSVFLHEVAHIKRRDTTSQLLAEFACALHWFNPLVWFASWCLRVERERACDDLVLASGVLPSTYADHMLQVATRLSPARLAQASGLAMARKSSLEGRLNAVLSKKLNRRGVSVTLGAFALALGVSIAVPIAMLKAVDGAGVEVPNEAVVQATGEAPVQVTDDDTDPRVQVLRDGAVAFLLTSWQDREGRKTPLAAASLRDLRVAIDRWVNLPSGKDHAVLMAAQRDWNVERAEHPVKEVEAWLDEIAAIHPGPLAFAIRSEVLVGKTLSAERQATLKFGPTAENGLRAAWSRYPARDSYLLGDVVYSRLVVQNVSEQTIEFECPHSLENIVTWDARAAAGRTIEAEAARYTGTFPLFTWRLKPGAFMEISGRVAIGQPAPRPEESRPSYSTLLQAERGEHVTVRWQVREPVEMVTGVTSFEVVSMEEVPVWSTSQKGEWPLPGGVTMVVKQMLVHASDISSDAILTWPTDRDGGTARHRIWLGGDAFANRDPWLLAWQRGASVLWEMSGNMQSPQDFYKVMPTPTSIRKIDFSDPKNIKETVWSYGTDVMPDVIRREMATVFRPFSATPITPAHATPLVKTVRAEDVRTVNVLLGGTWKSVKGNMDVRITFPTRATDPVTWTMTFVGPQGNETVSDSLTRMDSPQDGSVQLTKLRRQPRTPGWATLGRLRRGLGDTLLLDVKAHVDFPQYQNIYGIVLERVAR